MAKKKIDSPAGVSTKAGVEPVTAKSGEPVEKKLWKRLTSSARTWTLPNTSTWH